MAPSLKPPHFLTVHEKYAVYQPVGELTKSEAVEFVDQAVLHCRENQIPGLVADITRATGLPMPSVSDVFWFITKWAETARGKVTIAMVAPPAMVTPDKIGLTVAQNRGMQTNIFSNSEDAVAWLRYVLKF